MMGRWIPAAALAAVTAVAGTACNGNNGDRDGVVTRDTAIMTVPDTIMVERTITEDTIRDPDLRRDTVRRDTM
jgi:hypothetical protein